MTHPASAVLLGRMMALHPSVIDMSLGRMERLLASLGNPQNALPPVIHIAGTNGKGSTQAMLRAAFRAAGLGVHCYTSPHLVRFHERIVLSDTQISEPALAHVLEATLAANDGGSITYFEATTAAALLAFANAPADVLLLEVGLGGRLDATNVIDAPLLTIITPVDLDHQEYLGPTLTDIATEKAGIMKRGVPCVVGPQKPEAMDVIEAAAARLGVPLLAQSQQWHVWTERGRLIYQDERGLLDLPLPALRGAHQISNAGMAIAALRHLEHDEATIEAALTGAHWPARMQRLGTGPLSDAAPEAELWLDGGHNPAAGLALAAVLADLPARPTWLVTGMLAGKDSLGFLTPLARHAAGMIAVPVAGVDNGHAPETLAQMAQGLGLDAATESSVPDALLRIVAHTPDARVLICGSLYLAGAVLALDPEA
ncbi:MAG: dihydrofolate synthase/folylpolyglutamate synthase [Paracoccaceae bacterium]